MLISIILVLIIGLFLFSRLTLKSEPSTAEIKGIKGEEKVNDILKNLKVPFFHDTLLKKGSISSQFDHIVVYPNKTVLVIETKNKDGLISGNSTDEKWHQVIGRNHYYFYNPMKQNEGHIKMLYRKMDQHKLYGFKILSLVVFTSDKCTLKNVPPGTIHINELPSALNSLNKKTFFNRSRKFTQMIVFEDKSKNKCEVQKHIEFAKRARYKK